VAASQQNPASSRPQATAAVPRTLLEKASSKDSMPSPALVRLGLRPAREPTRDAAETFDGRWRERTKSLRQKQIDHVPADDRAA